jgi:hypothetical protein
MDLLMPEYYEALHKCAERYRDMLLDAAYWNGAVKNGKLWTFLHEFMFAVRDRAPLMKLNRWLGYIQGCLIERGYTTVQAERDWTRPLFRPLDFPHV